MKIRFSDLKLKVKISIIMGALLVALFLSSTLLFLSFFRAEYEAKSMKLAEEWSAIIAKRLEQVWDPLGDEILATITSDEFAMPLLNMQEGQDKLITRINLQTFLNGIVAATPMVESAYIVTSDGHIVSQFSDYYFTDSDLLDFNHLDDYRKITVLQSENSPFKANERVIPIVVPLRRFGPSQYISMATTSEPDFVLTIILSEEKISQLLENNTTQFEFDIQLNNGTTDILVASPHEWEDTIIIRTETDFPGVELVMSIDADTFMPMQNSIIKFALILTLVVGIIGIIAVSLLAKRLTDPFQKITRMLERIKDNTYQFEAQPKYHDETGELISGINDMYRTILDNMETIRKTENEKFSYLSKMLTEQINPHFIYNTLEMINMEIQSGNLANASSMINYFALYLRTTLNNGEDLNTIREQTRNVDAYFRIMNARLNGSISFNVNYPEELANVLIPKSIMQPIVENAIKHGFDYARNIGEFILPEIDIDISGSKNEVIISISDNGKGIDVEATEKVMMTDERKTHMGISNIYKRLRIYDPESNIEIFSVPYFKNEFRITFHPQVSLK